MSMAINLPEWVVVLTTTLIVLIAVVFHYEVMSALNHWACRRIRTATPDHRPRSTILIIMLVLLITHVLEIWLFAMGYWLLAEGGSFGEITGYDEFLFLDYVYFSAANYSTVGWGDLIATGPIRFLAGTEALVGFMLITFSASFIYLIMSRTWRGDEDLEG